MIDDAKEQIQRDNPHMSDKDVDDYMYETGKRQIAFETMSMTEKTRLRHVVKKMEEFNRLYGVPIQLDGFGPELQREIDKIRGKER